ncbi:type 1 fimbrial protein [Comamonas sp. Tr-654]|uniref:type 1 fimbrial protein n=1 Tax=Comamonas sp. Tr-654 TaxID=2608341 RepID=UPI001423E548|nr:type 1 fimbrial protein [Comamonas sp. Tr-654]NIF85153.1 type 1 fimbrial protein [Comamonas sp. Tr-654]
MQDSGATITSGNLSYDMGMVTTKSLGSEATPATPVTPGGIASPTLMNLRLACASGSSVELKLTPTTRMGKGIATSGSASNVQIMLMQGAGILDFSNTGSWTLSAPLSGGEANFVLNAYYTLQAGKATSQVAAGSANGSLAYVLSYN